MVRLRSRKHEWFLVQMTSYAKASDLLKAWKTSWVRMQGGGEITDYTAGILVSTKTVRAMRWGFLIQGHTGHIFQFESYSELRSLGISSVSQTAVNEGLWNHSFLKVVTDLATTKTTANICTRVLGAAVYKHAWDHLPVEMELYRQVTVLLPDGDGLYTS